MNEFDIIFKCQYGEYKLEKCTIVPTKEQLEDSMDNLKGLGLGNTQEIIIKPIG